MTTNLNLFYLLEGQTVLVCNLGSSVGEIWNWPPYAEGKERTRKEVDHSRLVGGSFNRQRNLHLRLVLDDCKMSRSPHPSIRILKVYVEALTGFSHVFSPDGLNKTVLSQELSLKCLRLWESWVGCTFQEQGRGWGTSDCLGSALGSAGGHVLLMTSPNRECQWILFACFLYFK